MQLNHQNKAIIDFLIYSPSKSGTTSLALMLQQSPHIIPPKNHLEPHLFNRYDITDQDIEDYNGLFSTTERSKQPALFFEKSTTYFITENSIANIKHFCKPDLKFIVCLRNPVERFISKYIHFRSVTNMVQNHKTQYMDQTSLAHGWRQGWERSKQAINNEYFIDEIFNTENHKLQWELSTGCYINSLQNLYNHTDSSNIFIMNYHLFKQNNQIYIDQICNFLNIPHLQINPICTNTAQEWTTRSEASGLYDVRKDITQKHMDFLVNFYYECNEKLDQLFPSCNFRFNETKS